MSIIAACTTLLSTRVTACHDTGMSVDEDLYTLLILAQQGSPERASSSVLHTPRTSRSTAAALVDLLIELDLLLPDQARIDNHETLVTCCRVWRWVQAQGLTALPSRAVLHGLPFGSSRSRGLFLTRRRHCGRSCTERRGLHT